MSQCIVDHLGLSLFMCLMKSARSTPNSAVACDHKGSATRILQREVCLLAYACCVSSCQLSNKRNNSINWTFRLILKKFFQVVYSFRFRPRALVLDVCPCSKVKMIFLDFSLTRGWRSGGCRGGWTVVRETFRGICRRKPEPDYWRCTKFDWMSPSLLMHFWRSSGVKACCFWRVFLCQWVLGWWPEHSVVCLDLPRTIFTTSATFYERGVAVCSPWINNPRCRLSQKNGSYFYSAPDDKKTWSCKTFLFDVFKFVSHDLFNYIKQMSTSSLLHQEICSKMLKISVHYAHWTSTVPVCSQLRAWYTRCV